MSGGLGEEGPNNLAQLHFGMLQAIAAWASASRPQCVRNMNGASVQSLRDSDSTRVGLAWSVGEGCGRAGQAATPDGALCEISGVAGVSGSCCFKK